MQGERLHCCSRSGAASPAPATLGGLRRLLADSGSSGPSFLSSFSQLSSRHWTWPVCGYQRRRGVVEDARALVRVLIAAWQPWRIADGAQRTEGHVAVIAASRLGFGAWQRAAGALVPPIFERRQSRAAGSKVTSASLARWGHARWRQQGGARICDMAAIQEGVQGDGSHIRS